METKRIFQTFQFTKTSFEQMFLWLNVHKYNSYFFFKKKQTLQNKVCGIRYKFIYFCLSFLFLCYCFLSILDWFRFDFQKTLLINNVVLYLL